MREKVREGERETERKRREEESECVRVAVCCAGAVGHAQSGCDATEDINIKA